MAELSQNTLQNWVSEVPDLSTSAWQKIFAAVTVLNVDFVKISMDIDLSLDVAVTFEVADLNWQR